MSVDRSKYCLLCRLLRCLCDGTEGGNYSPPTLAPQIDQTFSQALKRLQSKPALSSVNYRTRRDGVNFDHAQPEIKAFAQRFVSDLALYNVPMFIHGIYRDPDEQDRLFEQGVTKARAGQSAHNFGAAADIVHYGFYWELTKKEWNLMGSFGKDLASTMGLQVTWGGDFNSIWDPAHWELKHWKDLKPRG